MEELFDAGPSAGGARPKATVRNEVGMLWLAKFPSKGDGYDSAMAEFYTLTLAKLCGMSVPGIHVLNLGEKSVLMIQRFYRYCGDATSVPWTQELHQTMPDRGSSEKRLPFVSGLTLIGASEMDTTARSYLKLGQAVRRHANVHFIRQNNRELFMRMVFNIFVSNNDDHLRNHGFVHDSRLGGWRLSPLYDVVPRLELPSSVISNWMLD
ncbi:MAG: HipA domain-containing protein [Methylophilaceae bacterium]